MEVIDIEGDKLAGAKTDVVCYRDDRVVVSSEVVGTVVVHSVPERINLLGIELHLRSKL